MSKKSVSPFLYQTDPNRFQQIRERSIQFSSLYIGNTYIQDDIFSVLHTYARKKGVVLELLRYPFRDNELWAFTFLRDQILFIADNTELPLFKQIFAAAHELYHIYCYIEHLDPSPILKGSLLNAHLDHEERSSAEDQEANAFAGLLLMPRRTLLAQLDLLDIYGETIKLDDILKLMNCFAIPYKAVVLRLLEERMMNESDAQRLLSIPAQTITDRIKLTGSAKRWLRSGKGVECFGSLEADLEFNRSHDFISTERWEKDFSHISKLKIFYEIE